MEEEPLGTAGPIASALDRLGDQFIVMNGDLLTTIDYRGLLAFHRESGAAASIAVHAREVNVDFGVVEASAEGLLERYVEKPTYHFEVSMGINVLSGSAVRTHLQRGERLDMPDLMLKLRASGERVMCYRAPCFWLDLGRLDDYQAASEVFEERRGEFLSEAP